MWLRSFGFGVDVSLHWAVHTWRNRNWMSIWHNHWGKETEFDNIWNLRRSTGFLQVIGVASDCRHRLQRLVNWYWVLIGLGSITIVATNCRWREDWLRTRKLNHLWLTEESETKKTQSLYRQLTGLQQQQQPWSLFFSLSNWCRQNCWSH